MTKIVLHLHYDGTDFCGWQKQPGNLPTVQAALETAVAQIAGENVDVIAAGRTDAGVHAVGQVAHFATSARRPLRAWQTGVNTYLPRGIAVTAVQAAADSFHARFDAVRRSYRYILCNSAVRPVLLRRRAGWTFHPLDTGKMHTAAQCLLGEQDFSSFRSSECQAKSPVKTLYRAEVYPCNSLICFDFCASGFLHHMVRNIVGALVYVGQGKITVEDFAAVIAARDRRSAPPTFMPDGLYLTRIDYPESSGIAAPPTPAWFYGKPF